MLTLVETLFYLFSLIENSYLEIYVGSVDNSLLCMSKALNVFE
jgi:hypothetical protein